MCQLEASSMFFHPYAASEVFAAMDAAHLDSVEFWMETPLFWLNGTHTEELLVEREQYPHMFPIAMHAPIFDLNPCSFNEGVAKLTADYSISCIDMLSALGGGILTIHPGKRTAKRPVSYLDMERFHTYLERLEKHSEKSVRVSLENMPYAVNAHMITPEEMRKTLDEYSWLYFTFDYAHALQAESAGKISDALSFIDVCGDRMVNIHASMGGSLDKMHTPLQGTKEGDLLLQKLSSAGYSGRITFEFEDLNIGNLKLEDRISLLASEASYFRSGFPSI